MPVLYYLQCSSCSCVRVKRPRWNKWTGWFPAGGLRLLKMRYALVQVLGDDHDCEKARRKGFGS